MKIDIKYQAACHKGRNVIFIQFEHNSELNIRVKKLVGVRWSQSNKAWYVLDSDFYREKFGLTTPLLPVGLVVTHPTEKKTPPSVHAINEAALRRYIETLQLRAYSLNTINTYKHEFMQLLYVLKGKHVDELDANRLRDYFVYCTNALRLSENTLHSRINAVKFYYEKVLGRVRFFYEIPRPKKPILLPNVLAISQVERLFMQLENLKHKTMLYLAYSAGLRVSEVVNLRVKDIHSARMVINIKGAKGKKDRMVSLSQGILELLRRYYLAYKPKHWLFEGQYNAEAYSTRSLQLVFHRAKNEAKIIQDVTFHSLRHSYATHLHERGTDIKLIQELLGHNDIKTTLRYTHVSTRTIENVGSPFDQLNIKT